MVFSLVACGKDDDTDDSNKNDDNTATVDASKLFNAIIAQLGSANSAKIDIDLTTSIESSYWDYEDYDEEKDEGINPYLYTWNRTATVKGSISVIRAGSTLTAKIDLATTHVADRGENGKFNEEGRILAYFVDGTLYVYNEDSDAYKTENIDGDFEEILAFVLDNRDLDDGEAKKIALKITEKLAKALNVKDGVGGEFNIDLKKTLNDYLAIVNGLTPETKVADIINPILAILDKDLTITKLIDELEAFSGLTVKEGVEKIDKYLADEFGTSLQAIVDDVLANDELAEQLADELEMTVEELRAIKIYDLLSEHDISNAVIFDLIAIYVIPEDAPAKAELFTQVKELANGTLGDLLKGIFGYSDEGVANVIDTIKRRVGNYSFDKLEASVKLNLKSDNSIDNIALHAAMDLKHSAPSPVKEGEKDTARTTFDATVTVGNIDTTADKIALPEDAAVIPNYNGSSKLFIKTPDNTFVDLGHVDIYYYEDNVEVTLHIGDSTYSYYHISYANVKNGYIILPMDRAYNEPIVSDTNLYFDEYYAYLDNLDFIEGIGEEKLDVGVYWASGEEDVPLHNSGWTEATSGIFSDYLWEPGFVAANYIKIANEGDTSFFFELVLEADGEISALADVIDVYFINPATGVHRPEDLKDEYKICTLSELLENGYFLGFDSLEPDEFITFTIALKMQETAGNEYQGLTLCSLSVKVDVE